MKKRPHQQVLYPAVPAIEQLVRLIDNGLDNPMQLQRTCQLDIVDGAHVYPIRVSFDAQTWWFAAGRHDIWHTRLTMPLRIVEQIVAAPHQFDFKSPESRRHLRVEGDSEVAFMITMSMLRPHPSHAATYRYVEQRRVDAYRANTVERFDRPSETEIERAIANGTPVVATGFDMPISYRDWNLDLLVQRFGEVPLLTTHTGPMSVAQFVGCLRAIEHSGGIAARAGQSVYTAGCVLPPAMRADFIPALYPADRYLEPRIWFGSVPVQTAATGLHCDPFVSFLYQVMGRKRFRLFSPDQADLLYVMRAYNRSRPCWVSAEAPDYTRFPAFAQARQIDVEIGPGDLLVLPPGWFHAVYCVESPTLSVSYFMDCGAPPALDDECEVQQAMS
jgi:hypothetical protein